MKAWPWVNGGLTVASVFALLLHYHLHGNTTDPGLFSQSAFGWMTYFWSDSRVYGGARFLTAWFVPVLVAWLLWRDRAALRAAARHPSWWGFALVLTGLLLHGMGLRAQQTRLSLLALIFTTWAIPFYLYGWAVAKRLAGPWALLVFMVPLNFFDVLTFPLRRLSAGLAAGLLNGLGVNAQNSGSLLRLAPLSEHDAPLPPLDAADAAAGIGLLLSLLLLISFWCMLRHRSWARWLLLVLGLPAAFVTANMVRLTVAALVQLAAGPEAGATFYLRASLPLAAALAVMLLLGLDALPRLLKPLRSWKLLQPEPPSIG